MNHVIPIAFLLAVLLITLPITNASTQQIEGKAQIVASCGVEITDDIDFGTLTPGTDGLEVKESFKTSGSQTSSISLMAFDWVGDGSFATGKIYLGNVVDGDSITINGLDYTGKTNPVEAWEFLVGKNIVANTGRLANVINEDVRDGITDPDQDVTATATDNMIKIQATALGKTGNDIDISSSYSSFTIINPTLSGAQDVGAIHLAAEVTKYFIATTPKDAKSTHYADKTPLGSAGKSILLTDNAGPVDLVELYLQISAQGVLLQNMPYMGDITQTLTFTIDCND